MWLSSSTTRTCGWSAIGPLMQPLFHEITLRNGGLSPREERRRAIRLSATAKYWERRMPTIDAQGRTISDDGHYWWDGNAWQLIPRPAGKTFLDSLADSVEGAVKKVEDRQAGAPIVQFGSPQAPGAPPARPPRAPHPA